jgi:predicted NUDIX family NTP pyrophosphohydrolase
MAKQSAGLLIYRFRHGTLEVFLVHPGGPYWARKDAGSWSIPKGELGPEEDALEAAKREFEEETGFQATGPFIPLSSLKQPGGKLVHAWAAPGDFPAAAIKSNLFTLEWPPRSGKKQDFPEIDRAEWFSLDEAREKILKGQADFLTQLGGTSIIPAHEGK